VVQAFYNSFSVNAEIRCFKGTREGIIAEIMQWFAESRAGTPQVFWLSGIAGIGKSTLARTVAENAENIGLLGGSFFFSRADGYTDASVFFSTIAHQLARTLLPFKTALAEALKKNPDLGRAVLSVQVQKLIIEPLRNIQNISSPILLVVDALDECSNGSVRGVLTHLLSTTRDLPFLKVLITGRPDRLISSIIDSQRNLATIVIHDIEKSIADGDIILYLRFRFDNVIQVLPGCRWFWKEGELIFLGQLAGGLFIYAVTAMNIIEDRRISNPRKQLERFLRLKDSTNPSPSPIVHFGELDRLYNQVVGDTVSPDEEDTLAPRFRLVVGTIITWAEPMSLNSIEKLMQMEEGDAWAALQCLPSVIAIPESPEGIPRIYHPSFPDFITNPKRCTQASCVIDVNFHHTLFTTRCFELMASMLKRDICNINDRSLLNSDVEDLESKLADAAPPWLCYACFHWAWHLDHVPHGDEQVKSLLQAFCSKHLLYWIELVSLLRALDEVIDMGRKAYRWAVSWFIPCFIACSNIYFGSRLLLVALRSLLNFSMTHFALSHPSMKPSNAVP